MRNEFYNLIVPGGRTLPGAVPHLGLAFMHPDIINDPLFGRLTFDPTDFLRWYKGVAQFAPDDDVEVLIYTEGGEPFPILDRARAAFEAIRRRASDYPPLAAKGLVETYNANWNDGAPIDGEAFASRIWIYRFAFYPDGTAQIDYDDDEMFWATRLLCAWMSIKMLQRLGLKANEAGCRQGQNRASRNCRTSDALPTPRFRLRSVTSRVGPAFHIMKTNWPLKVIAGSFVVLLAAAMFFTQQPGTVEVLGVILILCVASMYGTFLLIAPWFWILARRKRQISYSIGWLAACVATMIIVPAGFLIIDGPKVFTVDYWTNPLVVTRLLMSFLSFSISVFIAWGLVSYFKAAQEG